MGRGVITEQIKHPCVLEKSHSKSERNPFPSKIDSKSRVFTRSGQGRRRGTPKAARRLPEGCPKDAIQVAMPAPFEVWQWPE